jgi:hypothetical protein
MHACRKRGGGLRGPSSVGRHPPVRVHRVPAGDAAVHLRAGVARQLQHQGLRRVLQPRRGCRRDLLQLPEGGRLRWPEVQVKSSSGKSKS